ncbi:MAG: hypothetical protein WB992_16070 [Bryobacteraceae bacterium]
MKKLVPVIILMAIGPLLTSLSGIVITASVAEAQVSFGGHIDVDNDLLIKFPDADYKAFSFHLASELQQEKERERSAPPGGNGKGFTVAARVSNDGAVSVMRDEISGYPLVVTTKSKDGSTVLSLPGAIKFKIDLKSHVVIHADGFDIESTRDIKAGESFPALCVNGEAILSIEASGKMNASTSQRTPVVQIFSAVTRNRTPAILLWRFETGSR